jgi:hypothetical protein
MNDKKRELTYEEEMACIDDDKSDNSSVISNFEHAKDILTEYYILPTDRKSLATDDKLQ